MTWPLVLIAGFASFALIFAVSLRRADWRALLRGLSK